MRLAERESESEPRVSKAMGASSPTEPRDSGKSHVATSLALAGFPNS